MESVVSLKLYRTLQNLKKKLVNCHNLKRWSWKTANQQMFFLLKNETKKYEVFLPLISVKYSLFNNYPSTDFYRSLFK